MIRQDTHGAVRDGSISRAELLVDEAYELGRAESRKALGRAWGAFLGSITKEMWDDIRVFCPELYAQVMEVLGVKNG